MDKETQQEKIVAHCSFCGKELTDNGVMLTGITGMICPECVALAQKVVEETKDIVNANILANVPKPKEIKEFLDQYVIGQDRVKERVAVAVYNHYKRISAPIINDVEIEKSNILVCGPTGSGKCISGNTKVKIRNKKTGKIYYDTINNLKNILITGKSNN